MDIGNKTGQVNFSYGGSDALKVHGVYVGTWVHTYDEGIGDIIRIRLNDGHIEDIPFQGTTSDGTPLMVKWLLERFPDPDLSRCDDCGKFCKESELGEITSYYREYPGAPEQKNVMYCCQKCLSQNVFKGRS